MNFIRTPLFVHITDIHKQITEHERLILVLKDKTASFSFRTLDIGTFFFAKRACSFDVSDNELVASFDEKRRYFLKCFTDYLLQMDGSDLSKGLFYCIIKMFLDWIDQQKKIFDLSDKDSIIDAYRRYSKSLVDRTLLADTDEDNLAAHTAKQYQRYVAKLIAYVFDCHEIDISSQAMQVQSQRYDVPILPIAKEDHEKTYATLLNVFLEIHRIVVQENDFPAHFQSVDEEDFYFYSGFHHQIEKQYIQFDMQRYLAKYTAIPSLSKMLADFELEEDSEHRKRVRENRNQAIRKLEERNKNKRHLERERLASYGLTIGMLLFIAQTGANLDTAQQLHLDTMEILPSTQGRRFSGTKSRARGKTVRPEFGVKFEPIFRKILELRAWYIQDESCDFVFPLRNEVRKLSAIGNNKLQLLKRFLQRIFPKMAWITPQEWRKHVSSQYVELSDGDLLLEVEKMGHSLDTAKKNYSRTSFKDASQQISQFFYELREVAVSQTRTVERIPVQTLDETADVQTLPVGACTTISLQPEKATGFTAQAPTPNCQQFEHCLFCQHYAVHADDEDVRKLLSLKSLLGYVKQKATDLIKWEQQFGVVLHRIDEVLNELSDTYENLRNRIFSIQEEVESGDLDAYWLNHFELLIDLGWIS
ncbi:MULTISPECIES: hypothetical protein [Acinetobacter]|uniref:Uncharacterized protein n=1 Tax=Acinetobacter junii TaxID=40215 RepID=A0A365PI32_ACIJU|nr:MULTISPECIES: hypothetical protein [Acinetobacter]RBA36996.1 hypothetical protein DDF86_07640 [Acinetobacter junii]RBA41431.1 hypothetical protein DDG62_06390 [Acinetobacter junii]RBA46550.1 hypothetical protein DC346_10050 [Acinetobacter junii]WLF72826.1 hypothetical protein Q4617_01785 [Acinetobacter junii]